MTYEEFVSMLMQNYNEQNPNRGKILLEWLVDSVDQSQLKVIFKEVIENEGFFPGPDKIKKYLTRLSGDDADKAFSEAMKLARSAGSYKSIKFDNGLIAETIQRGWGGWPPFCVDEQDNQWKRKTFVDIYNALSTNAVYESHLAGIIEREKGRFHTVEIKRSIGDQNGRMVTEIRAPRFIEAK